MATGERVINIHGHRTVLAGISGIHTCILMSGVSRTHHDNPDYRFTFCHMGHLLQNLSLTHVVEPSPLRMLFNTFLLLDIQFHIQRECEN